MFICGSSNGFDPAGTRTRFPSLHQDKPRANLLFCFQDSTAPCNHRLLGSPAVLLLFWPGFLNPKADNQENYTFFEGITAKKKPQNNPVVAAKANPQDTGTNLGCRAHPRGSVEKPPGSQSPFSVPEKGRTRRCWALPWLPHGVA